MIRVNVTTYVPWSDDSHLVKPPPSQNPTETKLGALRESTDDLLAWVKFQNLTAFVRVLTQLLDEPKKLIAYENTDGTKSMQEVADAAKVPKPTVQGYWKQWSRAGIVRESSSQKGRMQKLVSLVDFGLLEPSQVPSKIAQTSPVPSPSLDAAFEERQEKQEPNASPKNEAISKEEPA